MKICEEKEKKPPEFIDRHLYRRVDGPFVGELALYYKEAGLMVPLDSGRAWAFGPHSKFGFEDIEFEDVTDQYCLKRIK